MDNQKKYNDLFSIAFSIPFSIAILCLSILSFLKRNEILSFKGFLDSLVEIYHSVTYAISQFLVFPFDWLLPWELNITPLGSDAAWLVMGVIFPTIYYWKPYDFASLQSSYYKKKWIWVTYKLFALAWFPLMALFFIIYPTGKEEIYSLLYLALFYVLWYPNCDLFWGIITRNYDEILKGIKRSFIFYKNYIGAMLIALMLYFTGYIELILD